MIGKIFLLLLTMFTAAAATQPAEINSTDSSDQSNITAPERDFSSASVGVVITAQAGAVVDTASGEFLFQKQVDAVLPIASLTKLMTVLVFLDSKPDLNAFITMSESDEVSSAKYVYRGETVTVDDLLHLSLIGSDNNATRALVRASGFEYNEFIAAMNRKARDLGMDHTSFQDPTGLTEHNVSTAADLVRLGDVAFHRREILTIGGQHSFTLYVKNTGRIQYVPHTNHLYDSFLDVVVGKTGYTDEAGYCLMTLMTNEVGNEILVIVLDSAEPEDRFQDSKALGWWTFANYIWPASDEP